MHPRMIPAALRELAALGIIQITMHGRGGNAEYRQPNRFLLNYQCGAVDAYEQITNAWNKFKTLEEAEESRRQCPRGQRSAQGRTQPPHCPKAKYFPGAQNVPEAGCTKCT